MKKFLLASTMMTGALLAAGAASAADMSYPVKAPVVAVAPAFSWTGFYLGVHGGYGGNEFKYPFYAYAEGESEEGPYTLFGLDGEAKLNSSGFFAGGQVGYNYQFSNNWVAGVEADIAWSGIEGEVSLGGSLILNNDYIGSASVKAGSEIEWFGTVRARLGYAYDTLLLYGTGGLAYGKVKSSASLNVYDEDGFALEGYNGSISADDVQWGWTIGAGLEYAINNNWTFKTEYLYVDLGSQTLASGYEGGVEGPSFGYGLDVETKFHTIKAGLNYKF